MTGNPPLAPSTTYTGSVEDVFGVTLEQLRVMADQVITDENSFPVPVPTNSIIIVDVASMKFDAARPLAGTGIVVFEGSVTILSGSNSAFNGMLYVDQSLSMRDPSEIRGAVVVNGNFTIQGAHDYATIAFDDDILNALRQEIGQYRISSPIARPHAQDFQR